MSSLRTHGLDPNFDILAETNKYRTSLIAEKSITGELPVAILPGGGSAGRDAVLINDYVAEPYAIASPTRIGSLEAPYPRRYTNAGYVTRISITPRSGGTPDVLTLTAPDLTQPVAKIVEELNRQLKSKDKVYGLRAVVNSFNKIDFERRAAASFRSKRN